MGSNDRIGDRNDYRRRPEADSDADASGPERCRGRRDHGVHGEFGCGEQQGNHGEYATSDGTAPQGTTTQQYRHHADLRGRDDERGHHSDDKEDDIDEDNETFIVQLSAPVNAAFAGDVSSIGSHRNDHR